VRETHRYERWGAECWAWAVIAALVWSVLGVGSVAADPACAAELRPVCIAPVDWSVPRGYRGMLVRKRVDDFPAKLIALTFDDGPDGKVTPPILEALAAHRAKATFFVLGERVQRNAGLLRRMASTGHAIGNHSFSHPAYPSAEKACTELADTARLIRQVTGRPPSCFRPPYGIITNGLTSRALGEGYVALHWTVLSADDHHLGTDAIVQNVTRRPRPGDIVLMHDGPGHHATARAVPAILDKLAEAGFQCVTVPELLQAWDEWLQRGRGPATPS
jgi:peptidoglycan/xylan/chitin deacetylase (PgdA/CDA1 family)